jgi:hypothetical protein
MKKYQFVGSAIACVSLNSPFQDLILFPGKVYSLNPKQPMVRNWISKNLLLEVN